MDAAGEPLREIEAAFKNSHSPQKISFSLVKDRYRVSYRYSLRGPLDRPFLHNHPDSLELFDTSLSADKNGRVELDGFSLLNYMNVSQFNTLTKKLSYGINSAYRRIRFSNATLNRAFASFRAGLFRLIWKKIQTGTFIGPYLDYVKKPNFGFHYQRFAVLNLKNGSLFISRDRFINIGDIFKRNLSAQKAGIRLFLGRNADLTYYKKTDRFQGQIERGHALELGFNF